MLTMKIVHCKICDVITIYESLTQSSSQVKCTTRLLSSRAAHLACEDVTPCVAVQCDKLADPATPSHTLIQDFSDSYICNQIKISKRV